MVRIDYYVGTKLNWAEDGTYWPDEYYSPEKFFNDCLNNSNEFDLQLGYFNSAAISVLAESFATFISKNGCMRLIINHIVSEKDKEAINNGVYGNIVNDYDLNNFEELKKTLNDMNSNSLNVWILNSSRPN